MRIIFSDAWESFNLYWSSSKRKRFRSSSN